MIFEVVTLTLKVDLLYKNIDWDYDFWVRGVTYCCYLHMVAAGELCCLFWQLWLAHLSQRLKWAIVIAHRPSIVRRPSVNFYIFNFFSRTAWWILIKLGRDEVLMVPYKCCCFSARSAKGRIQGGAKIGHGGSPSSRIFFFRPEGYSNKLNA